MVTKLSDLAELIEKGAVPGWLVQEIEAHKSEISSGETVTFQGPNGETVVIESGTQKAKPVAA
jgi:hypothetical protein